MAATPLIDTGDIKQGGQVPIEVPSVTQPDPVFGFGVDGGVILPPDGGDTIQGPPGPEGPEGEQGPQ